MTRFLQAPGNLSLSAARTKLPDMSTLSDVIGLLESGDWQTAHRMVQGDSSPEGCWAHGIAHIMEGDMRNAGHWYGRAGRELPDAATAEEEIRSLKQQLASS